MWEACWGCRVQLSRLHTAQRYYPEGGADNMVAVDVDIFITTTFQ